MADTLTTALRLAHFGWRVFPLVANQKKPLTPHGFRDASTDPDTIVLWWKWWPEANLGIATGAPGPDVLDVDRKAGVDGRVALEKIREAGLLDGAIGRVATPSGGEHWYFRGTRQTNGSIRRRGVDLRSAGGYVVAPPSTVDGKSYTVTEWRPGARGRALDWEAVRGLLDPPRPQRRREAGQGGDVTTLARWLARQPEGNRNGSLYWASCRAIEGGHDGDLEVLIEAAQQAGLPEAEARRTVDSAARRLGGAA